MDSSGSPTSNPVLVEVVRGDIVESRHRAAVAVVDASGNMVLSAGDFEQTIFPRSAIKPLQALALIESGAADAFGLSDAEVALACASHNGEDVHRDAVLAWLERLGLGEDHLVCGTKMPGRTPAQDNCSGKHAGFLSMARRLGHPIEGYHRFDHPVQQRTLGVLEQMTELDLGDAPRAADGCGIPALAMALGNVALAMARLADPHDQPEERQAACARIRRAMAANPYMVAGKGRFCTRIMEVAGGAALVKAGAEGVHAAALPQLGLGIALKVDDGARRAAEVIMGRILCHLEVLDGSQAASLHDVLEPAVSDRAGSAVGIIRMAETSPL